MNKSILLGLLLVPCFAHAMEQIHKDGNDKCVEYWTPVKGTTDIVRAYRMENANGERAYSAYRQDKDGFSVDCCEPQKVFEGLQQQYAQQEAKREQQ